ncbi:hypothetical protein WJX72_004739 [[Myrmecia] bisecta]|uniref:Glutathione S-transferase 3, mitochondrial n=1 Tax=[Myrmecia] bisecta TaxID=41462 RepID=A0AAW1Q0X8_9CHLO
MAVVDINTGLTLRPEHGYVLLAFLFAIFAQSLWMMFQVGAARRRYKVFYPNLYADKSNPNADAFNCVQRGHQNTLENLPTFIALLLVAGLKFPVTASIAGVIYTLGKIAYFKGYASGKPAARQRGSFSYIGLLTLMGCVAYWAFLLLTGK